MIIILTVAFESLRPRSVNCVKYGALNPKREKGIEVTSVYVWNPNTESNQDFGDLGPQMYLLMAI